MTQKRTFWAAIKQLFFAGLLLWLPIIATIVVIRFILQAMDGTLELLPSRLQPEQLFNVHIPGLGVVFTIVILLLTGFFVRNFIGHKLVQLGEAIVGKIPLIRSIYSPVKQVLSSLLQGSGSSFRKVVLIEYPKDDVWCIGFLTSSSVNLGSDNQDKLAIFVPTTPNPTSGFLVFVSAEKTIELDISIEQALRLVMSLGVVMPQ